MSSAPNTGTLPPHLTPQPKSGSGVWKIVIILLLAVVLLVGGCVLTCIWGSVAFTGLVMQPINAFVEEANTDTRITERLGSPVELVPFAESGQFSSNSVNDRADITFQMKGPNGTATANGKMEKVNGTWRSLDMTVTFSDGSNIHLPETN